MQSASKSQQKSAKPQMRYDHDAKIAEALKAKAAKMLNAEDMAPNELSALSRVFDTAQKMGLLALGAATANTTVTTRTLEPIPDDEFLG